MAEDSLIREVDADLRQERMHQMWRRYRMPLLLALLLLIAITAGNSIWRDHQTKKNGEAMLALDNAIAQFESGDAPGAAKNFTALAKESNGELRDMARLWQSRAEAQAEQPAAAVKTLTDLAEHPAGKNLVWRDLACLRLLGASADAPKSCATKADSPLRAQRLEWHAAWLWQQGKSDEARDLLNLVASDESVPKSQRDRAKQLLRTLPAKAA